MFSVWKGECYYEKRMLMVIIALALGVSSAPLKHADASWHDGYNWYEDSYWYDNEDDDDWYEDDNDGEWYYANNGWYYGDDDWYDDDDYDDSEDWDDWYDDYYDNDELTVEDLAVSPAKKTIRAENSFYIDVIPSSDSGWEDLEEDDWEELCADNIESIEYRSTKSRVASVNKFTGKVKAKRKGSAVIKTRITLINDESIVLKTKVVVTR